MTKSNNDFRDDNSKEQPERKGNLLEIIFTVFSAAAILAVVIYLVLMIMRPMKPAEFELTQRKPEKRGDQWHVEINARNTGDEAVRAIEVEGTLDDRAANVTIDWLPGKSTRGAILVFDEEPTTTIELAVKGYLMP